uniref:DB domain-containing protein n=1 Tax=Steinernema glaseri TaxID=37863 RepID=A0A1I7Y9W9_9BILA
MHYRYKSDNTGDSVGGVIHIIVYYHIQYHYHSNHMAILKIRSPLSIKSICWDISKDKKALKVHRKTCNFSNYTSKVASSSSAVHHVDFKSICWYMSKDRKAIKVHRKTTNFANYTMSLDGNVWEFLLPGATTASSCVPEHWMPARNPFQLRAMFLRLDACPLQAAAVIHYCAARGKDHTRCCESYGVTATSAGSKCAVFCNQVPGNVTQLDMSYLPCYDRFDEMKSCFWHSAVRALGYSCGSYGCHQTAKARALSAKKVSFDGKEPLEEDKPLRARNPDEEFQGCCEEHQLPDPCLQKCSYATYSRDSLRAMFLRLDACPLQAAAVIHYCAARGKDHTRCCESYGVTATSAGSKCAVFCNQVPGNVTQLDMSYLPCYDRFDEMKSCFWHSAVRALGVDLEHFAK